MENRDLSKFIRLAKTQCANYGEIGPEKKTKYCWDPKYSVDHRCKISDGEFCEYFDQSVVAYKPFFDLKLRWDELWGKTAHLLCKCGKRFVPTGRRQKMCPECGEENKKTGTKNRVRKHRAKEDRV